MPRFCLFIHMFTVRFILYNVLLLYLCKFQLNYTNGSCISKAIFEYFMQIFSDLSIDIFILTLKENKTHRAQFFICYIDLRAFRHSIVCACFIFIVAASFHSIDNRCPVKYELHSFAFHSYYVFNLYKSLVYTVYAVCILNCFKRQSIHDNFFVLCFSTNQL